MYHFRLLLTYTPELLLVRNMQILVVTVSMEKRKPKKDNRKCECKIATFIHNVFKAGVSGFLGKTQFAVKLANISAYAAVALIDKCVRLNQYRLPGLSLTFFLP